MQEIMAELQAKRNITKKQLAFLLDTKAQTVIDELMAAAREDAQKLYGKRIYMRGLIEFSNFCKNNCLYCGIRKDNCHADRYRLTKDQILDCCRNGYRLGFRTFVLQSGEDPWYTDDLICDIVSSIKRNHPDCAVTLSIGEKTRKAYERYYEAGADRYLLRHETADQAHYERLHPPELSFENRIRCLRDLKEIGYQTGCGFMVGSPYQTIDTLYQDLRLIKEIHPEMVGIGPFIPQKDTPFGGETAGTLDMTLRLLAIIRLIHPTVLLPATTALGTIHPQGREKGILAGANVVMPNLSPVGVRKKYILYDNKICTGEEAAECVGCMMRRMENIGYQVVVDRGDYKAG